MSSDVIDLDSPEPGLNHTLLSIQDELGNVREVRRDVRGWALKSSLLTSLVILASATGLIVAFRPQPLPAPIVIQPASVAVVIREVAEPQAEAKAVDAAKPAHAEVSARDEETPLSESQLHVRRALAALWSNKPKVALREIGPVLKSEPRHVDALAAKAFALYELHRDKSARSVVKKALKLNPKHPLANVLRGTMAQVDRDLGSALAHYDRYLKARPKGELATELEYVRENLSYEKSKEESAHVIR